MLQIGNLLVDAEDFSSVNLDKIHKKLSKLDSKHLAEIVICLSEKLFDSQKTKNIYYQEMMSKKKSIGGVTVDF